MFDLIKKHLSAGQSLVVTKTSWQAASQHIGGYLCLPHNEQLPSWARAQGYHVLESYDHWTITPPPTPKPSGNPG